MMEDSSPTINTETPNSSKSKKRQKTSEVWNNFRLKNLTKMGKTSSAITVFKDGKMKVRKMEHPLLVVICWFVRRNRILVI